MSKTTGSISIDAKNIMPVIKRWLYSDKDIFIREMVSNGADAITKYKMLNPGAKEEFRIVVTLDREKGEIVFDDNGIGMTAEEVEKYINQVAFSGAEEFLKNYTGGETAGIIGHFGLGFYSAFMAADRVAIESLSHLEGAESVRWESRDGMTFDMEKGERQTRGTAVTLHIAEDEKEFLESGRVREVLNKYCGYMPVPIYFVDVEEEKRRAEEAAKKEENKPDGESAEGEKTEEKPEQKPVPVNEVHPLWYKNAKDCTDDEYKETYRRLFHTWEDPLFWIHLNVDYPFNLKGILYFPRIRRDFAGQEGEIKLFNRQVYVADNIKEIIPEFLMVLKGVIDCPDLPLNVSRSFLQNDGEVKKISRHIAKKAADKLVTLFKTERETYERYWDDINPFIKYGCLRDDKFHDAVKDALLYKTTDGKYLTLDEYRARNEGKTGKKVYYAADADRQAAAVALFTSRGIDVALMDTMIDMSFMSFMEYQSGMGENAPRFMRVDADVSGLVDEEAEDKDKPDLETLKALFREALGEKDLEVKLEALQDKDVAALVTEDEQMRRFKDMSALYGQDMPITAPGALVLNAKNAVISALANMEAGEKRELMARQVYDLALLSARPLEKDRLRDFLSRSARVLSMLAE